MKLRTLASWQRMRGWWRRITRSAGTLASCTPEGVDADALRKLIHTRFDLSLGTGLGKVKGRMFRIGHLGDCNDLTLMAALSGCEMGLKLSGVRLSGSGVLAAMEYFAGQPMAAPSQPAQ